MHNATIGAKSTQPWFAVDQLAPRCAKRRRVDVEKGQCIARSAAAETETLPATERNWRRAKPIKGTEEVKAQKSNGNSAGNGFKCTESSWHAEHAELPCPYLRGACINPSFHDCQALSSECPEIPRLRLQRVVSILQNSTAAIVAYATPTT